jgi:hypothetical protein
MARKKAAKKKVKKGAAKKKVKKGAAKKTGTARKRGAKTAVRKAAKPPTRTRRAQVTANEAERSVDIAPTLGTGSDPMPGLRDRVDSTTLKNEPLKPTKPKPGGSGVGHHPPPR